MQLCSIIFIFLFCHIGESERQVKYFVSLYLGSHTHAYTENCPAAFAISEYYTLSWLGIKM